MNAALYFRLALANLKNNRKLYLPYLLTGTCMVMVTYLLTALTYSKTVRMIKGGESLQMILSLGIVVIAVFSVLFLFYISGFLMKRRKREFGLYNVLGMGKKHIAKVMLCENLFISAICIFVGLLLGGVFLKATELCLINLMKSDVSYDFTIDGRSMGITALAFAVAFLLVYIKSRFQMHIATPVELMRESAAGEKQPRANYLMALIGILLLGAGYYLALTVENALGALTMFFIAVILVILGTYCCFMSLSVAVVKLLKRNKGYYYRAKHFISVSGMAYRMRRNGAGLATICILSTMVLVMLSSVTCLYVGSEKSLSETYPRDVQVTAYCSDLESLNSAKSSINKAIAESGVEVSDTMQGTYLPFSAIYNNGRIEMDRQIQEMYIGDVTQIFVLTLDSYREMTGISLDISDGEAFIYDDIKRPLPEKIVIDDVELKCAGSIGQNLWLSGNVMISNSMYIVVKDDKTFMRICDAQEAAYRTHYSRIYYYRLFNVESEEESKRISHYLRHNISFQVETISEVRDDFYALYAGLFFLGIVLGLTFIAATVLIMYYKQVTEGYEDQARFVIMQNVGMTDREIKKAINSQILTVFFLPLIAAVIHLIFAFPMVNQLLRLFALNNTPLFMLVTGVSILVFSLMYVLTYKITSYAYLRIIRARGEARIYSA